MSIAKKGFITTIDFGDAGKRDLSYGTAAMNWLEEEAEKRTGVSTSFMVEIEHLQEQFKNPDKMKLRVLVHMIRAGHAHLDAIPSEREIFFLLDGLAGNDRVTGDPDNLVTLLGKILVAVMNGIPGFGAKKKQKTGDEINAAMDKATAQPALEGDAKADPTVAALTGTPS